MANSNWQIAISQTKSKPNSFTAKVAKAAKRWQLAIRQIWFTTSTFKGCGEVF
jgi:hypothetical protein